MFVSYLERNCSKTSRTMQTPTPDLTTSQREYLKFALRKWALWRMIFKISTKDGTNSAANCKVNMQISKLCKVNWKNTSKLWSVVTSEYQRLKPKLTPEKCQCRMSRKWRNKFKSWRRWRISWNNWNQQSSWHLRRDRVYRTTIRRYVYHLFDLTVSTHAHAQTLDRSNCYI